MSRLLIFLAFIPILPILLLTGVANAAEPSDTMQSIAKFIREGHGREAAAGIITLVLYLWRRFGSKLLVGKLSSRVLPFVTAAMGFLAALPAALTAASFSWGAFVFDGLLLSAEAIALWSMLGKFVLPKVFGELPEAK